jgi:RNA-binding protein 15
MALCEKLNKSASKTNSNLSTVYSVQFILKSHAYDARMHFLAGNPQLANAVLRQSGDRKTTKTELKVTQRLRLDQHKLDDLEKKLRTSVTTVSSKTNLNGQSTSTGNLANQTKFAVLITSPKTHNLNGNPLSEDENDDRTKKGAGEDDDESSLSRLISYLAVKEAAGVINLPFHNDHSNEQETAVLHIFPPCQFSKKFLRVVCPSIGFSNGPRTPPSRPTTTINDEHLMVVITYSD